MTTNESERGWPSETMWYLSGGSLDEHIFRQVSELQTGEELQAWHKGKLYHSGTVLRTLPSLGLITLDTSEGTRLVDAQVLDIARLPATKAHRVTDQLMQPAHGSSAKPDS
jgi:hypothetical protein